MEIIKTLYKLLTNEEKRIYFRCLIFWQDQCNILWDIAKR